MASEFYVNRSIGHVVIVAALLICALVSLKKKPLVKFTLPNSDAALIAMVGITFVYTSVFAEPNYGFLIPSASIQLFAEAPY